MSQVSIEIIHTLCKTKKLRFTNHMEVRMLQRGITTEDVEKALLTGEIIEQYPEAYPYPACLVLGLTLNGQYIHITCGASETELWLVTAYYPDREEWENNFKNRKGQI